MQGQRNIPGMAGFVLSVQESLLSAAVCAFLQKPPLPGQGIPLQCSACSLTHSPEPTGTSEMLSITSSSLLGGEGAQRGPDVH